jgi:mannose-6-phosphate isomerase-like protein (cupin superfamily)
MAATKTQRAVADRAEADSAFAAEGCSAPRPWSNGAGDTYATHRHPYHKVLFCLSGSIVFHTDEGTIHLRAGDRLDLEPNTDHSAIVGPDGVGCVEASR